MMLSERHQMMMIALKQSCMRSTLFIIVPAKFACDLNVKVSITVFVAKVAGETGTDSGRDIPIGNIEHNVQHRSWNTSTSKPIGYRKFG